MKKQYIGAGILFWHIDKNKEISVLLGKRKFGFDKGTWSIPGGGWDRNKDSFAENKPNLLKTALRETDEEIGLKIPDKKYLRFLWGKSNYFFLWKTFAVKSNSKFKVKKFKSEFSSISWFSISELPKPLNYFIPGQLNELVKRLEKRGII
jgi:8-oxo-dGTP pyrophosphatase MutT (NUDIX family)